MVSEGNVKLEAFKQAIEQSRIKRARDFEERGRLSRKLSDQVEELSLSASQRREVLQRFSAQQDEYLRESRKPVTIEDFKFGKVIGAGAFGIVRLCEKKATGEVVAVKQMRKAEMVHKNHVRQIRAEKDALSSAQDDWVVRLLNTFQDRTFLYMVMDYLPGGDLMTHLQRKDIFTEAETRFYVAELVQAVDYIHTKLHCIHRDIKPDNVVFDAQGHIHLVDFGLCKHGPPPAAAPLDAPDGCAGPHAPLHPLREQLQSAFGTPDYMGPEAYRSEPCGKECDWWSVGVMMFEMLFGGPPFSDEHHDPAVTAARVKHWRQHFFMPMNPAVSQEARDLIRGLICDPEDRLDAEAIRAHPFFSGIDFEKLRQMEPPIKPVVSGPFDTSNFDDFSKIDARFRVTHVQRQATKDPTLFAFHDYDYRRDLAAKKPSVAAALGPCALKEPMVKRPHARLSSRLLSCITPICA